MKLREARLATRSHDTNGSVASNVPVQEGANHYRLYVRDELPESTAKAWDALKATVK